MLAIHGMQYCICMWYAKCTAIYLLVFLPLGSIRLLASAGNYVSVGTISASINNIDLRTGEILASWRPGDKWPHTVSPINQVDVLIASTVHVYLYGVLLHVYLVPATCTSTNPNQMDYMIYCLA